LIRLLGVYGVYWYTSRLLGLYMDIETYLNGFCSHAKQWLLSGCTVVSVKSNSTYSHIRCTSSHQIRFIHLNDHTYNHHKRPVFPPLPFINQPFTQKQSPHEKTNTMAPTPTIRFSALLSVKFGKSDKHSTMRCHSANQGKSGVEAERVRAPGALHSLQFKKCQAA
jgi:hypothetical protein